MFRLRSLLSLKSSSIVELSSQNVTEAIRFAPFHSTSVLSEKSRSRFGSVRSFSIKICFLIESMYTVIRRIDALRLILVSG
jgi:hypothetical protein